MIKLVFKGTKGMIKEENFLHRENSCVLLEVKGTKYLVDYGETWRENVERLQPDFVLISHSHPDHCFGNLEKEVCYMTRTCWNTMDKKRRTMVPRFLNWREFKDLGHVAVMPLHLAHSVKHPMAGFLFQIGKLKLFYASDCLYVPKETRSFVEGVDIWIGDSSAIEKSLVRKHKETGEVYGHASMKAQLRWMKNLKAKNLIFTHFGSEAVEIGDREVKKRINSFKPEVKIYFASDGKEFRFADSGAPL